MSKQLQGNLDNITNSSGDSSGLKHSRPIIPVSISQLLHLAAGENSAFPAAWRESNSDPIEFIGELVAYTIGVFNYKENSRSYEGNTQTSYNATVQVTDGTYTKYSLFHTLSYNPVESPFEPQTYYRFICKIKKNNNNNFTLSIQSFSKVDPNFITLHIMKVVSTWQNTQNPHLASVLRLMQENGSKLTETGQKLLLNKMTEEDLQRAISNCNYIIKANEGEDCLYKIHLE